MLCVDVKTQNTVTVKFLVKVFNVDSACFTESVKKEKNSGNIMEQVPVL